MEEQNKKTLIEALSSLPEHEPKEMLWEQIEHEMEGGLEAVLPAQLLQSLPQYEPPANAWDSILKRMEAEGPSAKIIGIGWRKALAVAASLTLILVIYWQVTKTQKLEINVVAVNFSEENADPMLLQRDWNDDEEAFTEFLNICQEKKIVCEQPEFQQLQVELEELTSAKNELAEVLGDFGTDADLVTQIKEIELQRNDILKKMMVMLI